MPAHRTDYEKIWPNFNNQKISIIQIKNLFELINENPPPHIEVPFLLGGILGTTAHISEETLLNLVILGHVGS